MNLSLTPNEAYSTREINLNQDYWGLWFLKAAGFMYKLGNLVLGIVGLVLIFPIFIAFVFTGTALLWIKVRKDEKQFNKLLLHINEIDANELISIHLRLESIKLKMEGRQPEFEKLFGFFPSRLFYNQLNRMIKLYSTVESRIKTHLYPNINESTSEEDKKRLMKLYQNQKEDDWDPQSSDLYEKAYLR